MGRIILRRMVMLLFVVFGVTLITFVISRIIPGDPILLIAGPRATPETVAALRAALNLDQPLVVQYFTYLTDLLQGDFGLSIMTRQPVLTELLHYIPATAELMVFALILSTLIGLPLGVLTAVHRNTWIDSVTRGVAILGISAPSFWLGLMLILLFYNNLEILPAGGRISPMLDPPQSITGFYMIDSLITGNWQALGSSFQHILLPGLTLSLISIGAIVRLIRSSMIDVLGEDYIRTVKAYGIPKSRVVFKYALRNALMPFVTVLGLELATLLFGSVVIETVFAWPGVGNFVLEGILNLDFPVIMGFAVVASVVYVFANLLVDISYILLDPKIRSVA